MANRKQPAKKPVARTTAARRKGMSDAAGQPAVAQSQKQPSERSPQFQKNKVYKFGVIAKETERDPQWRKNPMSQYGSFFHRAGARTLRTYLEKNPHALPSDQTLTFYEVSENGDTKYFGQGTPAPRVQGFEEGMSDGIATSIVPGHGAPPSIPGAKEIVEMMQRQLDQQQLTVQQLLDRIDQQNQKYLEVVTTNGQLQTALHVQLAKQEAQKEAETELQSLADEMKAEMGSKGVGMEDIIGLVQAIGSIAPLVVPLIQKARGGGEATAQPALPDGQVQQGPYKAGSGPNLFAQPQYDVEEQ